jgi:serine/threonine-protein kinase
MPLVRGTSLAEALDRLRRREPEAERAFSLTRLVQALLKAMLAVGHAHARGVVHRDLKPANLLLGEHGEVLVVDWGLGQVVGKDGTALDPELEGPPGQPVGTAACMAPERVSGGAVDAAADVYAFGTMLYEVLALRPPFVGDAGAAMAARLAREPPPPRAVATPGREVPPALEEACLEALGKDPDRCPASVSALYDRLRRWLEGEEERRERRRRAEEKAEEGRQGLAAYHAGRLATARAAAELAALRTGMQSWSGDEKRRLFAAEDRLAALGLAEERAGSRTIATLTAALGFDPEHGGARQALADYYMERFRQAEAAGDVAARAHFAELTLAYHDGRHARELDGRGSLTVTSEPAGAEVVVQRLEERQGVLAPADVLAPGTTPLGPLELAMGSYLVLLRHDGWREACYPLLVGRNRDQVATVRLYRDEDVGPGFVHVPAGLAILGFDEEEESGFFLPRAEVEVADFAIAEQPVTLGEYLEFLDDLGRHDPERARRHGPRLQADGPTLLELAGDGRFVAPAGRPAFAHPRLPVTAVSRLDAEAFCAWRSARDGRRYRLPTEPEWEKAARGVDGRSCPWGNRFDPALANMRLSHPGGPRPVPVDDFPTDRSPYGVRGMGGNVRQWTATSIRPGGGAEVPEHAVLRGIGWNFQVAAGLTAYRTWSAPHAVALGVGFRLAHSLGR